LLARGHDKVLGAHRVPELYNLGHGASWKLDQASGWESRPGRYRNAG
jgi:hypothetical protein